MSKLKVINLIGAPGSGKSTIMADLFAIMKRDGYNTEMITEYAKDLVWHDRSFELKNQLYITGMQSHKIWMMQNKVDLVITDSPLILGVLYLPEWLDKEAFTTIVMNMLQQFDNKWFFIERVKPYDVNGRVQSEKEAIELTDILIKLLSDLNISYTKLDGKEGANYLIKSQLEKDKWLL